MGHLNRLSWPQRRVCVLPQSREPPNGHAQHHTHYDEPEGVAIIVRRVDIHPMRIFTHSREMWGVPPSFQFAPIFRTILHLPTTE